MFTFQYVLALRNFRLDVPGEYTFYVGLHSFLAWTLQMTWYEHYKNFFGKFLKSYPFMGLRII